jgi:hypothetical protein
VDGQTHARNFAGNAALMAGAEERDRGGIVEAAGRALDEGLRNAITKLTQEPKRVRVELTAEQVAVLIALTPRGSDLYERINFVLGTHNVARCGDVGSASPDARIRVLNTAALLREAARVLTESVGGGE